MYKIKCSCMYVPFGLIIRKSESNSGNIVLPIQEKFFTSIISSFPPPAPLVIACPYLLPWISLLVVAPVVGVHLPSES